MVESNLSCNCISYIHLLLFIGSKSSNDNTTTTPTTITFINLYIRRTHKRSLYNLNDMQRYEFAAPPATSNIIASICNA